MVGRLRILTPVFAPCNARNPSPLLLPAAVHAVYWGFAAMTGNGSGVETPQVRVRCRDSVFDRLSFECCRSLCLLQSPRWLISVLCIRLKLADDG